MTLLERWVLPSGALFWASMTIESIVCDVGGRDCRALRIVWRGMHESNEAAFLRCFRMRCSPKDGSCGRTVRFSIDDELLIRAVDSFRTGSSAVAVDCVESEAVGTPTGSVGATEEA